MAFFIGDMLSFSSSLIGFSSKLLLFLVDIGTKKWLVIWNTRLNMTPGCLELCHDPGLLLNLHHVSDLLLVLPHTSWFLHLNIHYLNLLHPLHSLYHLCLWLLSLNLLKLHHLCFPHPPPFDYLENKLEVENVLKEQILTIIIQFVCMWSPVK